MGINWENSFDIDRLMPLSHGFTPNKRFNWVSVRGIRSLEAAFSAYSPLASIISKMAAMFANGKFEVLNRRTQNYTRGEYKEWDALLANPNFLQTGIEFRQQLCGYVMLNGWCYALPVYPSGFSDLPAAIFLLPPWMVEVEPIQTAPHKVRNGKGIRKVYVCWGGKREEIDESKLILFKDSGSFLQDKDTWLPLSRINDLKYPLSNGIGGLQSRNSLIEDRGASGILANTASDVHGAMPLEVEEQERLERIYKKKYGLTPDKSASIIITAASLKWQPMTMNVADLMLHEEHVSAIKDICDRYGYQYRLLSTGEGATFANAKQDKQSVYYDSIIPLAQGLIEQLNTGLKTAANNIELVISYDHIPDLQQSEKEKGEGRFSTNKALLLEFQNGILTRNQWLIALGRDTVQNPVFDKYTFEMTPEERGMVINNINNDDTDGDKEK